MEKITKPSSGFLFLFLSLAGISASIFLFFIGFPAPKILGVPLTLSLIILGGFFSVDPNQAMVLLLFGEYKGTVKANGFFWVNPFMTRKKISLRVRNFEHKPLKVNDKIGNPVMIGTIVVWQVKDTFKTSFDVEDYENFVHLQTDAAVRKMARLFCYDNFDDNHSEVTLRSGVEEVNHSLEKEIAERLLQAGIKVIEARISNLAYAAPTAAQAR
jgi:regulator of protease activity HflC (stomatin/prohibitin superfamily)